MRISIVASLAVLVAAPALAGPSDGSEGRSASETATICPVQEGDEFLGLYQLSGSRGQQATRSRMSVRRDDDGTLLVTRQVRSGDVQKTLRGVATVRRGLLLVEFGFSDREESDADLGGDTGGSTDEDAGSARDAGGMAGVLGRAGQEDAGSSTTSDAGETEVEADPTAPITLGGSVGRGGQNRAADVKAIQEALVARGYLAPGSSSEGRVDAALVAAIKRYQKDRAGFRWPDGRVDVDNRTLRALNAEQALVPHYIRIGASVGRGGENRPADVRVIQDALQVRGFLAAGFQVGIADAALTAAIERYQVERAGFRTPDGRVDVADRTIRALNAEQENYVSGAVVGPADAGGSNPLLPEVSDSVPDSILPSVDDAMGNPSLLFAALPADAEVAAYMVRGDRILGAARDLHIEGVSGQWTIERGFRTAGPERPAAQPSETTPEETTPAEATPDVRSRIASIANQYRGWGWERQGTREDYAQLLFPHDTAYNRNAFAETMSSCGLFAMAVLRELGKPHPRLDTPYASQIGRAVANIHEIALEDGAWVNARVDARPQVGDMMIIGNDGDPAWGGLTHVLVVTQVRSNDGSMVVTSVDGGQPHVGECNRILTQRGGQLWLGGRRVMGWLDAGKLQL